MIDQSSMLMMGILAVGVSLFLGLYIYCELTDKGMEDD